jgi:hypothetical protein
MVLTAYSVLSRCAGLDSHRRSPIIIDELDPSVGRPGPHDLAVRIGRVRHTRQCVHRIPRPTLVTIAKRPLWVRDGVKTIIKFGKTEAKYFSHDGLTGIRKIRPTGKSVGSIH